MPSQMVKTGAADRDPPLIPLKPCEMGGRRADLSATPGGFKAANIVNNAFRVGKCMVKAAAHGNTFRFFCNYIEAGFTKKEVFFIGLFFMLCLANRFSFGVPSLFIFV